jgi:hypothetical protein
MNNKNRCRGLAVVAAFGLTSVAQAVPLSTTIINDTYWGSNDHGYGDVISSPASKDFFNIDHLKVEFGSGHQLSVTVYTGFMEGVPQAEGTRYGDLFISSTGWDPHVGTDPLHLTQDRYSNTGTQWNYVIDTSQGGQLYGGNFNVYLTDDLIDAHRYIFRNGQVVQRKDGGTLLDTEAVLFGSEVYEGKTYNTITYTLDWLLLGVTPGDELAFKWGMTCANDTIEGAARVVPTPATLPLLAIGLTAGWLTRRRGRRASRTTR